MRLLHTADWHLGKMLNGASLLEDQAHALQQLVGVIKAEQPDAVLVAGDIFDRSLPPTGAVELLDKTLTQIVIDLKTPVIMIAGNHDGAERLQFGSRLLEASGFHVFGCTSPDPAVVRISGRHGTAAQICAVPFADPAEVRTLTGDESIQTHEQALALLLDHARANLDPELPAVAVVHAFVTGSATCDSERSVAVGGADRVSPAVFHGFNYVALGHLHSPQSLAAGRIRYSGSLLKYSASEAGHTKGVVLVEIERAAEPHTQVIPLTPLRDLRIIEGTLRDLEQAAQRDRRREDYVYVRLTDAALPVNAEASLRACYPNMLEYRLASLDQTGAGAPETITEGLDDMSLFERFHKAFTDEPFTQEDRAIIAQILNEINNAD